MSPLAMTTFIGDLFISCDNLRHHNAELLPLQDTTAKMVDWIDHAKNLCKPFRDIYYLVTSAAYEPGYWYFLKFLRNFIQHMRMDKPVRPCFHLIFCFSFLYSLYPQALQDFT